MIKKRGIDTSNNEFPKYCSFCGKSRDNLSLLFNGEHASICNECVDQLYHMNMSIINQITHNFIDIYTEDSLPKLLPSNIDNNSEPEEFDKIPKDIKEYLDQYIVGQDDAKKRISTIVYNHFKRINQISDDDVEIDKANMILIAPTGSGKTYLVQTLAKYLNIPCTISDCTSITQAGYVGEDIETIISRALQACNYDIKKVEHSIIYLDEVDKIAKRGNNTSLTRDVSGEGVQQGLLKLLEGSVVNVPPKGGRKHPDAPMVQVNTKNILFILGGAFVGLDNIIKKRIKKKTLGFNSIDKEQNLDNENILKYVTSEDLKNYGLIPEFIGRIPIITYMNQLTRDDLKRILTEPKNAIIKQYKKLFNIDNIELIFNDDVYDYLADCAIKTNLGARSLRTIVENLLSDDMYNLPKSNINELHITLDYAKEKLKNFMTAYN